jgi:putative OPT family oligopeptide transporter
MAVRDDLPEFTLRAAVAGVVFGIIFGAANAYLGLRVGLTVSTSIPIAVLTVALFRALSRRAGAGMILEANMSQTMGSASSSLASGTIFTIPALFMWGFAPPLWQVAILALLGGILGISAMVPLRRLLIVRSAAELPYPEGTACAQVLKATAAEASGGRWIFIGLAVGASVKLALGGAALLHGELRGHVPVLPKAELALEIAPALLGVGYILGYRQASIMVSGSLISALVLIPLIALVGAGLAVPLFPEATATIGAMSAGQIWGRYVRYIGAGAVAAAGIVTVIRALPTMYQSLRAVLSGLGGGDVPAHAAAAPRTDRDIPGWIVIAGPIGVVLTLIAVPGLLGGNMGLAARVVAALGVAVFGLAFVVVSSRIVGLIGVSSNPTSGMALVTLLGTAVVFVALGWTDGAARAAILTVGTVVCVAASKAGDISQDLKTGQLVGATPARQQFGQYIAAAFACWAVATTVLVLSNAYTFGSPELPAPQATLMRTVIDGVLAGALPWGLVGTGAMFALCAILAGLPGLSFAIGIYLPLGSLTPIFLGGIVRRIVEGRRRGPAPESDPGVLASSGLIAGEGLAGVAIALVIAARQKWPDADLSRALGAMHFGDRSYAHLGGAAGMALGVAIVAGLAFLLVRAGGDVAPAAADTTPTVER